MTVEFKENRVFTVEDYAPYMDRHGGNTLQPLPNVEEVDPLQFLNTLASGGHTMTPWWGYSRLPEEARNQWTQFFLTSFMGMNEYDGGGYAVTYGVGKVVSGTYERAPIVRRFAICKHEVQDHAGANHSRGWHPGHCKKCGMNMTYDSGD